MRTVGITIRVRSGPPLRIKRQSKMPMAIRPSTETMGSTDIDVVAPNGDLIAVGGPAKANNLGKLGQELRIYQTIADQRGVSAQVYFAEGTPQSAINLATKILGEGNVKIISGTK